MSTQTKEALEDALAAHVAAECDGELVGAWILVTETLALVPEEGVSTMHVEASGSAYACRGLLEAAIDPMRESGERDD